MSTLMLFMLDLMLRCCVGFVVVCLLIWPRS